MLDHEGNPLPDNECGSFTIEDPQERNHFLNTLRGTRTFRYGGYYRDTDIG